MIQLNHSGLHCAADFDTLRRSFAETHTLRLPQLLHPSLLEKVHARMEAGPWRGMSHEGISREVVLEDRGALHLLHFVVNTPAFLDLIRDLTGCAAIGRYHGRVYRMVPSAGHYDSWHGDIDGDRLIGMSLNLGPRPYEGGVFQLRRRDSEDLLAEIPNTTAGDAILFRLSEDLVHRVTPIDGSEPKTAFAGWFIASGDDFLSTIRSQAG